MTKLRNKITISCFLFAGHSFANELSDRVSNLMSNWMSQTQNVAQEMSGRIDILASYHYGNFLSKSSANQKNLAMSVTYLTKAANSGFPRAQYALGHLYEEGLGVERDQVKALEWYGKAAEQGDPDALYAIASYVFSKDPYSNCWYLYCCEAVDKGHVAANFELGYYFQFVYRDWYFKEPDELTELDKKLLDIDVVHSCYKFAAKEGMAEAMYYLASYYEQEAKKITIRSEKKELIEKAYKWYERSAKLNFSLAQIHLGPHYGVSKGTVFKDSFSILKVLQNASKNILGKEIEITVTRDDDSLQDRTLLLEAKSFKRAASLRDGLVICDTDSGSTPLHYVTNFEAPNDSRPLGLGEYVTKWLIRYGSDINAQNKLGYTPLHVAVLKKSRILVSLLLDLGADPNTSDSGDHHNTPLHEAIRGGDYFIVDVLLKKGASVNSQNAALSTPLHYAVTMLRGDMIDMLLVYGADKMLTDSLGRTSADLARQSEFQKIIDLFEEKKEEALFYSQ